ncbi:hypothetical protein UFOVP1604_199 [uncultured Caudovirales phage]|uniref:Uncharacterized protein n=1 Tax=uncultured Caudovirales phage TaxID=2100421 RepID=A0A6J5SVU1_9CAUD|nr:hypothetical protein UFOVP1604_199 [uncultured Caudovirales phage]
MVELGLASATPDRSIDMHHPDDKDWLRARNLIDSANPVSKSVSMSKLITDRAKLVRRAKAVAATLKRFRPELLGTVFEPFAKRMAEMGFTENQIYWTLETRWRF